MNAWQPAIESPWQLAGWTMLHFLWLGAAVAAAGAIVRIALRRAAPTLRYATSLTTLAALAVAPVAIAVWLTANASEFRRNSATWGSFSETAEAKSRSDEAVPPIDLAVSPLPLAPDPFGPLAPRPDAPVGTPTPAPAAPRPLFDAPAFASPESVVQRAVELLPWAWLVGAPLTFAWLTAGLVGSRRLQRASSPLVDGAIADACQRLQRALGVTRRVAIAVCDGLAQPVLVGIVKPTILLPASAVTGWTPEEIEMALVHELAHVRRWDNLVNFVQRVIESLLFFHPAVWLVSRQVRRDREECCDAIVVQQTRQPEAYATLLISIATKLRTRPAAALAVASALAQPALAGRVRRILKLEDQPMWVSRRWLAALVVVAMGFTGAVYGVAVAEPADEAEAKAAGTDDEAADDESVDSAPRKLTPEQREELHGLAEPGDVPAAVFVFPASPEEISRRVDELNWLGHNVRIANGDGFTVLFIKDLDPNTFRRPRRLAPHNVISVRVAGALDHSPIDDSFTIEEEGTIALGPLYGRVAVEGLTVLEAEAAITTHLETILTEPRVQVTLLAREADEADANPLTRDDVASGIPYADPAPLELRRLEAEIRDCQSLLAQVEAELVDIEVMKKVALRDAGNPDVLEKLTAVVEQVQEEIAELDEKIARLQSQGKDDTDPEFAMLDAARDSESEILDALLTKLRQARQENIPNEAAQAAVTEYEVRKKYLDEKKAEIEQRLQAARDRVEELSVGPAARGAGDIQDEADADDSADPDDERVLIAYPIGDIDQVNFQEWISLLGTYRDVEIGWVADKGTMIVNATREEHEAISALLHQSRTVPADVDAAEAPQLLEARRLLAAQLDQIEAGLTIIAEFEQRMHQEDNLNESEQAQVAEQEVRKKLLTDKKARVEKQLREIQSRLAELAKAEEDAGAGAGDAPAREAGPQSVDALYREGLKLIADGAYREAIKAFDAILAADATNANAHIAKGDALQKMSYFPEAAQSYSRALEIDVRSSAAYARRGACFMAMTPPDYDLAANDFHNALDMDRDNVAALASLGRIYARSSQDAQRAIAYLSEALQLDGEDDGIYRTRAQAYLSIGAYDQAESDAMMAVKLDSADPKNQAMLTRVRSRRQQAADESSADARRRDLDRDEQESDADDFRYDGKTFDEWRNLWRRELKTERRIEAIAALTAFGRRAYPREAAEAILDVAGEYDFTHDGDEPESDLKESVVRTFSYGGGGGIAPDVWLPILVERVRTSDGAEQQGWRDLLSTLMLKWGHGAEPRALLIKLAEDEAIGVQESAQFALAISARNFDDPELVRIVRQSLQGPRPSIRVLERRGFRDLDQIPEQFDVLLHDDPNVQAAARRVMLMYDAKHESWGDLYKRLIAVLEDPDRADDHLAAMRAIAALWPYLKEYWPADTELLMRHHRALATGDESLVPTTLWLLTKINGSDAQYVISRTRELLPEEFTDERVGLAMAAIKHLDAEQRAIYGE